MAPKHRIIIDTDPGVDDVLAMLLAFSATPEELEVLLVSVTFGNVEVENCLRNVMTLFHQIDEEMAWRRKQGKPEGFDTLRWKKPQVAVGASAPLSDHMLMADHFHGIDGLGGTHSSHPHLSPDETWKALFKETLSESSSAASSTQQQQDQDRSPHHGLFIPSRLPAHEQILEILGANEPDTITIVALGPATNLATAAAADPETFLRVKEVIAMGGAIDVAGNVMPPPPSPSRAHLADAVFPCPPFQLIKAPPSAVRKALNLRNQITPLAEFNIFADSVAAARLFALTSPNPQSTMPPESVISKLDPSRPALKPYPERLSRQLRLVLFPLDITVPHELHRQACRTICKPLLDARSPLAEWTMAFLQATFDKLDSLYRPHDQSVLSSSTAFAGGADGEREEGVGLSLHDPLCIWYLLAEGEGSAIRLAERGPADVRIEAVGQWTRGMCVVDRRERLKGGSGGDKKGQNDDDDDDDEQLKVDEVVGDSGNWLTNGGGNRVEIAESSSWKALFGIRLLQRIFRLQQVGEKENKISNE